MFLLQKKKEIYNCKDVAVDEKDSECEIDNGTLSLIITQGK